MNKTLAQRLEYAYYTSFAPFAAVNTPFTPQKIGTANVPNKLMSKRQLNTIEIAPSKRLKNNTV